MVSGLPIDDPDSGEPYTVPATAVSHGEPGWATSPDGENSGRVETGLGGENAATIPAPLASLGAGGFGADSGGSHSQRTDDDLGFARRAETVKAQSTVFSPIPYFGDRLNYTELNPSRWSVEEDEGDLRYFLNTSDYSKLPGELPGEYTLATDRSYADFTLSLQAKTAEDPVANPSTDYCLVFGYQDGTNYYFMLLHVDPDWNRLYRVANGSMVDIAHTNQALITDTAYHDIELTRVADTITLSVDGIERLSAVDSTFGVGGIGVGSLDESVYYDDITIAGNPFPIAAFTADPSIGLPPLQVAFDGSDSFDPDGTIVAYHWEFGDGHSAAGITATHTYNSAGIFTATLTVTDDQGALSSSAEVIKTIPEIEAYPATLSFSAGYEGSNPISQTLAITNTGAGTLDWSVSADVDWLTISPTSGSSSGEADTVTVTAEISGLSALTHNGIITITSAEAANSPQTIKVTLDVVLPAFPGAEGFGANSVGGRGGRVIQVTNLDDSGPGSLRAAIEAEGPRIVVFRVGGTIELQSTMNVENPFITIAGQTAPGGGITLKNHPGTGGVPLRILTHEVIVRYIRVRPGPGGQPDGILVYKPDAYNVIIDHCSVSWTVDENMSVWGPGAHDVTFQWCINSEGLFDSTAPEGPHSMGILLGGGSSNISVHHCLLAHNDQRNPRINNSWSVDFVNNVIYNYGQTIGYLSTQDADLPMNYVGNFVKMGVNGEEGDYEIEIIEPTGGLAVLLYVNGNIGPHRPSDDMDEALVVSPENRIWIVPTRNDMPPVTTTSAFEAYDQVLAGAGATIGLDSLGNSYWRRDAVDERIVDDVINGTGSIIDDPSEVGGWPELAPGTPPEDRDHDGMPNEWEVLWGFDPCNASDGSDDADADGYTNVEEWLNATDPGQGPGQDSCKSIYLPIAVR